MKKIFSTLLGIMFGGTVWCVLYAILAVIISRVRFSTITSKDVFDFVVKYKVVIATIIVLLNKRLRVDTINWFAATVMEHALRDMFDMPKYQKVVWTY